MLLVLFLGYDDVKCDVLCAFLTYDVLFRLCATVDILTSHPYLKQSTKNTQKSKNKFALCDAIKFFISNNNLLYIQTDRDTT